MSLPTDRDARNAIPVWDGCIAYFPDVWAEVAKVSVLGNKQHNLGASKLYWNTRVSTDHKNKAMRHMLDDTNGEVMDIDDTFHLAKAVWRLAAALQLRIWARDGKDEHGVPLKSIGNMTEALAATVMNAAFGSGGTAGSSQDPGVGAGGSAGPPQILSFSEDPGFPFVGVKKK